MENFSKLLPDMVSMLEQLVGFESPSHDKAAVDRLGAFVAKSCRHLGAQVRIHPQSTTGDHVEAIFLPSSTQAPDSDSGRVFLPEDKILLLCHMDTVFPLGTLQRMPFYEKEGMIYGPGVADMKGGIVIALETLASIMRSMSLTRPVTVLFTSDEETGSRSSVELIRDLSSGSSLVLVLEPGMPDGSLKTWRKGVGEFTVRVHGRAAHAGGDHQSGRNAIEEMAYQVISIQKMTDYKKGTTLNAGVIKGGIASNVVPAEAVLEVDLRVMESSEAERITIAMHALHPILDGTSLEVSGGINRPPMPYSHIIRTTFERVSGIAFKVGFKLKASGTGGASDANFVALLGIPVLDGLGPAGGEYHSEREFIIKNSLAERCTLLASIIQDWRKS
jgi:glutamate carboxypeptidase